MATLEKETISRSTPSNLEGLSEVKSGIKKNSPKYDKKRKSEKKLKYGEKKYLSIVNLQAVKLNLKKQCLLLLLLCVMTVKWLPPMISIFLFRIKHAFARWLICNPSVV